MITEDYVSFETAKLLKEKGFNEPTNEFFDSQKGLSSKEKKICGGIPDFGECRWNEDPFVQMGFPKFKTFAKPSMAQVMKWLREVHKLDIDVSIEYKNSKKVYYYSVLKKTVIRDIDCLHSETNFQSYEEACEAAIKYCLENLI